MPQLLICYKLVRYPKEITLLQNACQRVVISNHRSIVLQPGTKFLKTLVWSHEQKWVSLPLSFGKWVVNITISSELQITPHAIKGHLSRDYRTQVTLTFLGPKNQNPMGGWKKFSTMITNNWWSWRRKTGLRKKSNSINLKSLIARMETARTLFPSKSSIWWVIRR